jgi:hypothetical protein
MALCILFAWIQGQHLTLFLHSRAFRLPVPHPLTQRVDVALTLFFFFFIFRPKCWEASLGTYLARRRGDRLSMQANHPVALPPTFKLHGAFDSQASLRLPWCPSSKAGASRLP